MQSASLIDGHVHLSEIAQPKRALERARKAGVARMVAVAMDLESCRKTLALALKFPETVLPAIGYHPWEIRAEEIDDTIKFVEENLKRCVALGEVGLDYKVRVKKQIQKDVFATLLKLAASCGKPVIIHSRYSHMRTYEMAAAAGIEKAVFHWYSGPLDLLERIMADGYYVSATPALAYSPPHRAAMAKAPLERILLETDAPVEYGGRASEPANLLDTLFHICRIKKLPEEEVAGITTANAERFFGL